MNSNNIVKMVLQPILMVGLLIGASSIGYIFHSSGFPETNVVIIYLLAVHMIAWLTNGYLWGILASVISTFIFNYFFTVPYFTFTVSDPSYIITFTTMTMIALITSTITSHSKKSASDARQREAETKSVYNLTNNLTDAKGIYDIVGFAITEISACFMCQAAFLCFREDGSPERYFVQQLSDKKQVRREVDNTGEIKRRIERLSMAYDIGEEFYDWPIYGQEAIHGIIRIPIETAREMGAAQTRLLRSMIESIALALDRLRAAEERIKFREETIQERYRGNLLRAISHDLRTPLSSIMGTAEMLMDMLSSEDPRFTLALDIHKDTNWLHSLVENILSLTRLQEGRLIIKKQLEAVEEILGGAVEYISKQWPQYEINVSVPEELLLVPMDAKLIKQVLINLLDNAIKHTLPKQEIHVSVTKDDHAHIAVFVVGDCGSGISQEDLPNVFQLFYTSHTQHADAKHGIGLGLTICEAIINAHGGSIEARNRADKNGAEIIFKLPLEVENNEHIS